MHPLLKFSNNGGKNFTVSGRQQLLLFRDQLDLLTSWQIECCELQSDGYFRRVLGILSSVFTGKGLRDLVLTIPFNEY